MAAEDSSAARTPAAYQERLAFLSGVLADGKLKAAEVASCLAHPGALVRVQREMDDKKVDAAEFDELHELF
jgi:hypothetical protein